MLVSFECHKYSPELNKVYVRPNNRAKWVEYKGVVMPASGYKAVNHDNDYINNVREFRLLNCKGVSRNTLYAVISVDYCTENGKVIHTKYYSGSIKSRARLLEFLEDRRKVHNLPNTKVYVSSIKSIYAGGL